MTLPPKHRSSSMFSRIDTDSNNGNTIIDSLCIGSGRFLRAVLVPSLVSANYHPAIIQTRGRTFLDYCQTKAPTQKDPSISWTYEIDTVHYDGRIETTSVPCWGAGTLGSPDGKQDVLDLCAKLSGANLSKPLLIGIGVTEAGLSRADTKSMKDLYDVLKALSRTSCQQKICVINTDNVSKNGDVMKGFMTEIAIGENNVDMQAFLTDSVTFHNTMVDRITSQRPNSDGLIPRAEPTPLKALVIEDLGNDLPSCFSENALKEQCGVMVRTTKGKLDADIALKLRIANGTHTAIAHTMALMGHVTTDYLSSGSDTATMLMKYLDSFFVQQILKGIEVTTDFEVSKSDAQAVYDDWRRRLAHAHFGLSTFFITQNGAAKGGIRIGPTIRDLILAAANSSSKETAPTGSCTTPIRCSTVFALAAILRFLTTEKMSTNGTVFEGKLDSKRNAHTSMNTEKALKGAVTYADGLGYNLLRGTYEFRCDCEIDIPNGKGPVPIPRALGSINAGKQPKEYEAIVRAYLCKSNGGDLASIKNTQVFGVLAKAVAILYARMRAGDAILDILNDLDLEADCMTLVDGE